MSSGLVYVNKFFDGLEMYEDTVRGHSYKAYNREAVRNFLENETQDNALEVYRTFFDSYKVKMKGESNPFVDLVEELRNYERTAATLIEKQRDHFIHSVNVFVTGLSIFAMNENYRKAFSAAIPEKEYHNAYSTKDEEFFYRWGLAALMHDVGYPVEIAGNQITRFVRFIADADGKTENETRVKAEIRYTNFDELNSIMKIADEETFTKAYLEAYGSSKYADLYKPTDLIANRIFLTLGADMEEVEISLNYFVQTMAETGFIDHGYFSALILLKWYGYLIQEAGYKSEYLYWPVLDSATAILLHNYFGNVLQKAPFNLGPMNAEDNPIAYLLILCDELQEWNREAKGIKTKLKNAAHAVHFTVNDNYMSSTFVTRKDFLDPEFADSKKETINSRLNISGIFPLGFDIDNESLETFIPLKERFKGKMPRPLLENVEMLAIAIHEKYNEKRLREHPDEPLEHPDFSSLPDDMKYSNLRQARSIYEKLEEVGLCLRKKGEPNAITEIPEELVEIMAEREHDEWVAERLESGWTLGEKDIEKKKSPYLIPYSELSEEIKDYDRDTVRNIPELAYTIGMAVYEV